MINSRVAGKLVRTQTSEDSTSTTWSFLRFPWKLRRWELFPVLSEYSGKENTVSLRSPPGVQEGNLQTRPRERWNEINFLAIDRKTNAYAGIQLQKLKELVKSFPTYSGVLLCFVYQLVFSKRDTSVPFQSPFSSRLWETWDNSVSNAL